MRPKGTQPLEEWFVVNRDSGFGVCLSAKKHHLHSFPQAPGTILFTMAEIIPKGSNDFLLTGRNAMIAHKEAVTAAFVINHLHAPTPQELQTIVIGLLVQEWVDPNEIFGA
jgi:hypothetical protein